MGTLKSPLLPPPPTHHPLDAACLVYLDADDANDEDDDEHGRNHRLPSTRRHTHMRMRTRARAITVLRLLAAVTRARKHGSTRWLRLARASPKGRNEERTGARPTHGRTRAQTRTRTRRTYTRTVTVPHTRTRTHANTADAGADRGVLALALARGPQAPSRSRPWARFRCGKRDR